ncbi:MAG: GWxTD domain-containing protein [Candidatus Cloacimonadales bacterium]|nr:GWxTD domain-containing protein [Candidatus Cloacimonadales bacterium]
MKKIWFFLFIWLTGSFCFAESLPIAVDANRFLDQAGNTILDINYQIVYHDLKFVKTTQGFAATLETDFSLLLAENLLYHDVFTSKIVVTDEAKTKSSMQFTDKLSLPLTKSGLHFKLAFRDPVSENEAIWEYDFELIAENSLLSDLELSSDVRADTTNYLELFHRGNKLFMIKASHVFSTSDSDNLFVYYELYNFARDSLGCSDLQEEINLMKNDAAILQKVNQITSSDSVIYRIQTLPITELEDGYYTLEIRMIDNMSGNFETKSDFLSIKKPSSFSARMFVDLDDEFKLVSYFLAGNQLKTWKTLSETGKINYLNRFWLQNDPDPTTEKNEFFAEIQERIAYSNKKFSHFEQGWSTDRGRIYLKNGKPDEILEKDTGFNTKSSQKEYQIWKFRTRTNKTYIFIDSQMSGNFRLIYADGDQDESSTANWQDYLGEDFDFDFLE